MWNTQTRKCRLTTAEEPRKRSESESNEPLVFAVAVAAMLMTGLPVRAAETDAAVVSSFKNSYVYTTYLNDDSVETEAKDGVVTLTGLAKSAAEKTLVTELATDIHGVVSVKNDMTVEEARTT